MFRLKLLELKNFLSFEHALIDFEKPGLYTISGFNEKGGDSNGSGKSTIFSAITWALFNRTNTGLTGDAVTRFKSKAMGEVTLALTNEIGQEYKIIKTPKSIKFTIDGKLVEGYKRDIQQSINEAFKTDFYLFNNCNSFSQRSGNLLTSTSDADKKQFLKQMLGLWKLDEAQEKIVKIYDTLQREYDNIAREIDIIIPTLNTFQAQLVQATIEDASFEEQKHKKISILQGKKNITPLPKYSGDLDVCEKDLDNATKDAEKAKVRENKVKEELRQCYDSMSKAQGEAERLEESLNASQSIREVICEFCGSTINRKNFSSHKKEKQKAIEQQRAIELKCSKQIQELEQEIRFINDIYALEAKAKNNLLVAKQVKETYKRELEFFQKESLSVDREVEEISNLESPYLSLKNNLEIRISNLLDKLEIYKKAQVEVSSKIDIYGFLKWVLSREGVAAYIIEHSFGRLESLANAYLSKLCSEKFVVEIRPQKELKSKVLKEEIDIVVLTEERRIPYAALSDGQRQRVTIALLLSIFRLCRDKGVSPFDMLLLDEIVDLSLGVRGQEDVVRLLQTLKEEVSLIIVISHKDAISSQFDYEINVRRGRDGISKIIGDDLGAN